MVPMHFIVVETNKQLAQESFTREDAGKLFGNNIEVCFPNVEFGFNTYLNAGYRQLNEVASPSKYQVVMNNDVVLFNPDFMIHMLNGLRSVPSASPLGLREATWGLVNRSVPIDENYDINRSVNGWFLMFDKKILNAIPFEQLFPPEFTWYGGDIHYAESLEKFGYKHGLINAAQALHLQKQSHKLIKAKPESVSATSHLPSQWSSPAPTTMSNIISAKLISSREEMLKFIDLKNKDCVEVGVERGVFAQSILGESPRSLLLVDPWQHQDESIYKDINNVSNDEFERKFQECKLKFGNDPRVTLCRSFSVQAAKLYSPESLDFVYIDAIHTKEAVAEDMDTWWPLIKLNGWLCGHDYQFADVAEAVIEFINKNNLKLDVVTTETGPATSWGLQKQSHKLIKFEPKLPEFKPELHAVRRALLFAWGANSDNRLDELTFTSATPISNREEMLKFLNLKDKNCVEVGVDRGIFAQFILNENPKSLLLVDPWQCYNGDFQNTPNEEFEKRFQECKSKFDKDPRVTLCRSFSIQAAKLYPSESLDFVYIDAIHTKEAVAEDINAWWPLIKPNGWLCGHDYHIIGVAEAVIEFIYIKTI
jgi:predicted O-methyltransferase YrrM